MVAFIIITHNEIGNEMLKTVEEIIQNKPNFKSIAVFRSETYQETQKRIYDMIHELSDYNGIIILTDLFGATPSNLCKEFLINEKVEMITGCNLPMVIKAASTDFKDSPSQVAQFLKNYGQENIRVYSTDY